MEGISRGREKAKKKIEKGGQRNGKLDSEGRV
jgi:hypothetical protein